MGDLLSLDGLPLGIIGLIVLATVALVGFGAYWVVDAAAGIGKRLGISELIIGLTVVAMGTSAPEFAVTVLAAFGGHGDISVGNIVGSNIFNLGFILGGGALVRAIPTTPTLLRRDGTVLAIAAILLVVLIGWDLRLGRYDGVLLLVLLGAYLGYLFKQRRAGVDDGNAPAEPDVPRTASLSRDVAVLVASLICIVAASQLLVESSTVMAREFGVSEWVIGVTIVAAGTSAPELTTSLVGILRGRHALSAGTLIGSDIFNMLGVLGLAALFHPVEIDAMARISLVGLVGMVFMLLFFMRTGWRVSRSEGFILIAAAALRWGLDLSARGPTP